VSYLKGFVELLVGIELKKLSLLFWNVLINTYGGALVPLSIDVFLVTLIFPLNTYGVYIFRINELSDAIPLNVD
jgi:hypothetical protein